MPKVSVIIPTHQRDDMVVEAIESVLAQSFQDFEIVVVDDSSTDQTAEILTPYISRENIQYYYTDAKSAAAARNLGIANAKGELIAFLDSDDLWVPNKLDLQLAFIGDHPEVGLLHGGFSKFDENGKNLGYRDTSKLSGNIYPAILFRWSSLIMISTVIVPVRVFDKIGLFNLGIPGAEDLEMWVRIARSYRVESLPIELANVREHGGNISGNMIKRPDNFKRYLQVCFDNDPNLSNLMQRRIISKMYGNSGKNLLRSRTKREIQFARKFSFTSISYWAFQFEAYFTIIASLLSVNVRQKLYLLWLNHRYKKPGVT